MPSFTFHYGHRTINFSISEKYDLLQILPALLTPTQSETQIIDQAFSRPVNGFDFQTLISPDTTVAIVVNDKTRPVPNNLLIPALLDRLHAAGVKRENIRFIIGMGTHIPMPQSEFSKVLPQSVIDNYSIIAHNCDDDANLIEKGTTSRGTQVFVNRQFADSDVRIVVGNIEPHHFAGFSGGVKSAAIGVCGRKTINANHSLLLEKGSRVGNYETNPLRQDIEEIGRMIGVTLALNVVMNAEKQILSCFWGQPSEVMREGIAVSCAVSMQTIPNPVDLVIASAGGYPKDINLYQAQKAMTHASLTLKPGGILLLVAACEEGIGSQGYENFMQGVDSLEAVAMKFSQQGFSVGPHKAIQIARIAQEHPILLMSQLPSERVKELLLMPIDSIEAGLELALKLNPNLHSIAILPFAVSTIPTVQG